MIEDIMKLLLNFLFFWITVQFSQFSDTHKFTATLPEKERVTVRITANPVVEGKPIIYNVTYWSETFPRH